AASVLPQKRRTTEPNGRCGALHTDRGASWWCLLLAVFLPGLLPGLKLLCGELNRGPVSAGAVEGAVQCIVQLAEVSMCQAPSIADGHLAAERHVVHAPQHAAVRGPGQDQLL